MPSIETVRSVIRGSLPWTVLIPDGVSLRKEDHQWTWEMGAPSGDEVELCTADIAEGLKALENNPEALREWASFLMAGPAFISTDDLERSTYFDAIMDALWRLSFGEAAADELRRAVEAARSRP